MRYLTKSRGPLILIGFAAALVALSWLLVAVGFSVLADESEFDTVRDLVTAADWIQFAALVLLVIAAASATWTRVLLGDSSGAAELVGLSMITLIAAVGGLVAAVSLPNNSNTANVLVAIGIGGWAVAALVYAAHRSWNGQSFLAGLWLASAAALLLLAVAVGLSNPTVGQSALAVTDGILFAVGYLALAVTLGIARRRGLLEPSTSGNVALGLLILTVFGVATAVSGGFIYGSHPTFNWYRWGTAVPSYIAAIGFLTLAIAALRRLQAYGRLAAPTACWQCGQWLTNNVRFCPRCGAQVTAPPGYYPDPANGTMRWWDGRTWTEHVAPPAEQPPAPPPR